MILAGDIGGTKTYLALYQWKQDRVDSVREEKFYNADFESFEEILSEFLNPPEEPIDSDEFEDDPDSEQASGLPDEPIEAACFGVAGPITDNRCRATNLPWVIDGNALASHLRIPKVQLLNDVEAMAHGILVLRPDETELVNGQATPTGTKVLIAPGTGLGESILYWDGDRYHPMASEGGHASFAPTSDLEIDLLRYIRTNFLHVSVERVLSGEGLYLIYQFLRDTKKNEPTWFAEQLPTGNPPALISEAALKGKPEICVQAMELFVAILGSEAGNLALKALSRGGIYLGGGIVPRIVPLLKDKRFTQSFIAKGRFKRLLEALPVHVILNDQAGLLGSASVAAQLARAS
ncbi:glucokinase [Candidatus Nitronereus thalassa]|uniref:Glucokinase n=1 Tax=Candidatus Nitronereus thalassa TaxID=3020898 RepID=A0ABU3KA25_9BACT|nr:glucokinase [Candidatus Nitronereus thalassa]MDT7043300.1 glucokinase [Candidatus Nitronereus thalassa]